MKANGYRVRDLQVTPGGGASPRPMRAMAARTLQDAAAPVAEPGSTRLLVTVSGTIQLQ